MNEADYTILETDHWRVILRTDDQTYLGRTVVVCKRVVPSLPELTEEEWTDLKQVMTSYEAACKKAFGATMFNWTCLMNDAYQHLPPDPSVHWHVRPRYKQLVQFAGETFEDTAFGHHYERRTNRHVSDDVAKEIIQAIKKAFREV
jgi:diadenosine tetraphosphate (Ap4A) HIT family hydrolase